MIHRPPRTPRCPEQRGVLHERTRTMTALVAVPLVFAYTIVGLLTARAVYGRTRQRGIDALSKGRRPHDPVDAWECSFRRRDAILDGLFLGFFWPATLIAWALERFITGSPPPSAYELEAEKRELSQRLAELERELGIKGPGDVS